MTRQIHAIDSAADDKPDDNKLDNGRARHVTPQPSENFLSIKHLN